MKRVSMSAKPALVFVVFVVAAILESCGESGPRNPPVQGAKLVDVTGAVTVNGQPATAPKELSSADVVRVVQGGLARIQYPDGSRFLILGRTAAGSELTVGKESIEGGVKVVLLKIARGLLSFAVRSDVKERRFEIEAISSLTVVRGTEGKVQSAPEGDLVALKKGKVEVSSKLLKTTANLQEGFSVSVSPQGEIGPLKPYDFSESSERELYDVGPLKMKTIGGN
jgi:ferric-dicitrate binding protein FerR (iron transport regulator)